MLKGYEQRMRSGHEYWLKTIHATNKTIENVSATRAQGLRKHISDAPMRYTKLMAMVSDWAYASVKAGTIPTSISHRLPMERQTALLNQLAASDPSAQVWLKQLNITPQQVANLRNTGHLYNANWLLAHDTRWGVALIDTVLERMNQANLI